MPHFLLIFAMFSLVAFASVPARAADLASLPVIPPDEAIQDSDWLVKPIAREAGAYRNAAGNELILSNGLIRRVFRIVPNAATVAFDNLVTGESLLRGVKPEAEVVIDGAIIPVGGLYGQPNYAFLRPEWIDALTADPESMQFAGFEISAPEGCMSWKTVRHHAPDAVWPPRGIHLRMDYRMPEGAAESHRAITLSVHYELYSGVPVLSKWIAVQNTGAAAVTLERFASERLAVVEAGDDVETSTQQARTPNLHVETDYAFCGMTAWNTSRHTVRWMPDPQYETQVNYRRQTPCMLEIGPTLGPGQILESGEAFESFHAFILPHDSHDRERRGLAQRRMYRTIAPWVTENPLMMHVRFADWETVKNAIDQCAEVGFEMVILTFGSGFDIEDSSKKNVKEMKRFADYARKKGIEIGGYSLLSSRKISAEDDIVSPPGEKPMFDHAPCIGSPWGEAYFKKLYNFYEKTGFLLLEHDGSYPGDPCVSTTHPGHRNLEDSQWNQWRTITEFYQWCRGNGIYLNVPDYYYLAGSNKCGMGYRETNWSLPRDQQVLHTRQNIYDGTWEKTPSMGWMFVPLTEYQGGGEAATIEPLDEHLDHYEAMLTSNLAMGVQACYRGPRLFDTDRTREMLKARVDWYKQHRAILESDVIHGRRADGRDVDWMLHVNPALETKGMLVAFNPLKESVTRQINVSLYYTGLTDRAEVSIAGGAPEPVQLGRDYTVPVTLTLPPSGFGYATFHGR
ncbi:MAG: alpha-galactosidase [Candidatus Hydrogenedentes bacterium]|nr:alpha-galactosidase [Candidatus Hydrogenedentota bacterium]